MDISGLFNVLTGQTSLETAATWTLMKLLHDKRPSWLPEAFLFPIALLVAIGVVIVSNLINHNPGMPGLEAGWQPWMAGILSSGITPWAASVLGNNGWKQFGEMYTKIFNKPTPPTP